MKKYDVIDAGNDEEKIYLVVEVVSESCNDIIARCDNAYSANIVRIALERTEMIYQKSREPIQVAGSVEQTLYPDDGKFIVVEKSGDLTTITIRI